MITVSKHQYPLLYEKIKEAPTFVYSVLEGNISGTVYADTNNLNSLLVQTRSGLYYVDGDSSNNHFLHQIDATLRTSFAQNYRFTLFINTTNWEQVIEKQFKHTLKKLERYRLSFDKNAYLAIEKSNTCDYVLEQITQNTIKNSLEFKNEYYQEYWDSTHNFLLNGFGFCAKDGEKVVSEAVSIFKTKKFAEIDIATHSNYQGQGLARFLGEQFINYCLSQNIQPKWDCDMENSASIKLASKLGFHNPYKYAIYVKC